VELLVVGGVGEDGQAFSAAVQDELRLVGQVVAFQSCHGVLTSRSKIRVIVKM